MMYSGQAAIDYLINEVGKTDVAESSHWQKYHSLFKVTSEGFEGLQGFGGRAKRRIKILRVVEKFLQSRFRKMGRCNFSVIDHLAEEMVLKQNRTYDLDVLRQVLTISFLQSTVPQVLSSQSIGCVIGDGFASMTSLLLKSQSAGRVVLVNLNKTLLVDLWYLKLWMGDHVFASSVDLVTNKDELERALAKPVGSGQVIAIQAMNHELIRDCPIKFVVNIASMQEMDPPVIAAYFQDLRDIKSDDTLIFYCCNREEKSLPDGAVTKFSEYPWSFKDQTIVDELCPWHQTFYSFRPPFFRPYDGPIRHRLSVIMKTNKGN